MPTGAVALAGLGWGSPAAARSVLVSHLARSLTEGPGSTDETGSNAGPAGLSGTAGGSVGAPPCDDPRGPCGASSGDAYLADTDNHNQHIAWAGVVATLAGTPPAAGHVERVRSRAQFNGAFGIGVQGGRVFLAENNSDDVRLLTRYTAAGVDGGGVTDIMAYRPTSGTRFIKPSSGATPWSVVFGQPGDVVLQRIR